jgi:hypothetical protein
MLSQRFSIKPSATSGSPFGGWARSVASSSQVSFQPRHERFQPLAPFGEGQLAQVFRAVH